MWDNRYQNHLMPLPMKERKVNIKILSIKILIFLTFFVINVNILLYYSPFLYHICCMIIEQYCVERATLNVSTCSTPVLRNSSQSYHRPSTILSSSNSSMFFIYLHIICMIIFLMIFSN